MSRIATEIDFERDGRHTGFLRRRIPSTAPPMAGSRSRRLPAQRARPRVLLMAGNHGDEFEGQVALASSPTALRPEQITGRIIILPIANAPAARRGPAQFADRRPEPQPLLSRRCQRQPDRDDRPLHRNRAAAAMRCGDRRAFRRPVAAYVPSTHIRRSPDPADSPVPAR